MSGSIQFDPPRRIVVRLEGQYGGKTRISGAFGSSVQIGPAVMAPLEDAQAPSVAITQVGTIMVSAMRQLTASVSGGRYDTISYAWSVTQGTGTLAGSGARVTYNAPSAAEAAEVTCAVTVEGTGTTAVDGTSDTATDTEDFSVMAMVVVSTTIYAGWSTDETIETADFAGASEFTSGIDGTLPATASNGYIWFAVPAGATVGTVFIRGGVAVTSLGITRSRLAPWTIPTGMPPMSTSRTSFSLLPYSRQRSTG